jgi:hypothetical protein
MALQSFIAHKLVAGKHPPGIFSCCLIPFSNHLDFFVPDNDNQKFTYLHLAMLKDRDDLFCCQ